MKKRQLWIPPLLCLVLLISPILSYDKRDYTTRQYYTLHTGSTPTNQDSLGQAKRVAESLGARFEGQVGELSQYYWISIPMSTYSFNKRSLVDQFHANREKRDLSYDLVDDIQIQTPSRRLYKRAPPPPYPVIENTEEEYKLNGDAPVIDLPSLDDTDGYEKIKDLLNIYDPGFDQQWHLINREERGHDVNVTGVWSQGITGKNVVVAILDDGLDMDHPDLKDNYFAEGSYDFNDHVADPKPRLNDDTHGTRCAGEIAAVKNDVCGLGVAYDAKVSGIRILSGEITEADEAAALNFEFQKNHIYSCSWGPPDLGQVAEAPQGIILDAIHNGIENGRNGTGSIFVFASGNGGANDDNCNFDGYTNSIFTITVGAVDKQGNHPYYSERCAAQLAVTWSSGSGGYIYTTDVNNQCANRHGGTSAAAPLAAGIFALVLSVRPDLTWRDMQNLCVQSAIPLSLDDPDWSNLPSGRMFNHKYGYGVLDAYQIVELAKEFKSVRPQTHLEVLSVIDPDNEKLEIPDITPPGSQEEDEGRSAVDTSSAFTSTLMVSQEMMEKVGLARLEHVTTTVNIEHERRGDLEILLESPQGVSSQLGAPRQNDKSDAGLIDWTFMTVKHWEENPVGNWTLRVIDAKNPNFKGKFIDWKLTLWGEVLENFVLPSPNKDDTTTAPDIGVDDFEKEEGVKPSSDGISTPSEVNQSSLDTEGQQKSEDDALTSGSSYMVYVIVSVFMIGSIVSTAFIVKRYMLSTANLSYTRPTEEDTYEFDNLLSSNENVDDIFDDDSDEQGDEQVFELEDNRDR